MKLTDWAAKQGISYLTAYRWFKAGTLPVESYQTDSGTIIIKEDNSLDNKSHNEAISLLFKKTIEFKNNNTSLEDFAAYIISNFKLKINDNCVEKVKADELPILEICENSFTTSALSLNDSNYYVNSSPAYDYENNVLFGSNVSSAHTLTNSNLNLDKSLFKNSVLRSAGISNTEPAPLKLKRGRPKKK